MNRRTLMATLLVSACSSPEPTYYTLQPVPGDAPPLPRRAPRTVELRRPSLAGYLDRPEIVRAGGAYQLRIAGGERWGEPLGDLIGRVLTEDLSRRLPGTTLFNSAGSITADADATVEVDIQRFDVEAAGPVTLLAQVAVRRGRGGAAQTRTVRLQVEPRSTETRDAVEAMSTALGQLSDRIAELVRRA